jgi:hypothetical protein
MPVITKTIEGVEHSFAPLKFKELRQLTEMKVSGDGFERLNQWLPFLKSSVERGGAGTLPDFEEMDVDTFRVVFAEMIACVMEASGVKLAPLGEAQPVTESLSSGVPSMASSSPQPAGESAK